MVSYEKTSYAKYIEALGVITTPWDCTPIWSPGYTDRHLPAWSPTMVTLIINVNVTSFLCNNDVVIASFTTGILTRRIHITLETYEWNLNHLSREYLIIRTIFISGIFCTESSFLLDTLAEWEETRHRVYPWDIGLHHTLSTMCHFSHFCEGVMVIPVRYLIIVTLESLTFLFSCEKSNTINHYISNVHNHINEILLLNRRFLFPWIWV